MKTALVLGGGGAKGSYELGVLIALKELDVTFDIITGTSIGSVNAALAVQGDLDVLNTIWSQISKDQILKNREFSFDELDTDIASLRRTFKKNINQVPTDIEPFKNLINKYLNEHKIRNSRVKYGLVCVHFPSFKPLELSIDDIPEGKLHEYILASSSVFPAFPMCKIDDKLHIDGGYYDNVPINLAIKMGAESVVAIDLFLKPHHPQYLNSPLVKYIKTSWNLSPMLKFDQNLLKRNKLLGYNDTLKAYEKAFGYRYTFRNETLPKYAVNAFSKVILLFEAKIPSQRVVMKKIINYPLSTTLKEYTFHKLTKEQFFIRGLENLCELFEKDPTVIYSANELNTVFLDFYRNKDNFAYIELFKNILLTKTSILKGIDTKYLIGCILHRLLENNDFSFEIFWLATIFPKETVSAFYLYSLLN